LCFANWLAHWQGKFLTFKQTLTPLRNHVPQEMT
jgi:hypothetical protein